MTKPNAELHVTMTPGVVGGEPCVAGTRLPLEQMIRYGDLPESELLAAFPRLGEGGAKIVRALHRLLPLVEHE